MKIILFYIRWLTLWHADCSYVFRQMPRFYPETTMKTKLQQFKFSMNDFASLFLVVGLIVGLAIK